MQCDLVVGHTQLLLRAQGGDSAAFEELYVALGPAVRDSVAYLNGQLCQHERDDLVQEVFLRVWEGVAAYKVQASAKTYLIGVARNIYLERLRQRKREADTVKELKASSSRRLAPTLLRDSVDLTGVIRQLRRELPLCERQALHWVIGEDLSRGVAAKRIGCSANALYQRLYRAKKHLREMLAGIRR